MIVLNNYFFIDGSALLSQVRSLQRLDTSFANRKLCPKALLRYYVEALPDLHDGNYKRATFYFPTGDEENVSKHLIILDHNRPGEIRDLHFKYCGQKLKKSREFDEFVETTVPEKFRNRFSKSEKGIDIEICCDALKLASASRLERLFLFTNDDDFIPLCRTLKEFGTNISIIHLTDKITRNSSLLKESDTYDVVKSANLQALFLPPAVVPPPVAHETGEVASDLKPNLPPSDLDVGDSSSPVDLEDDESSEAAKRRRAPGEEV